MAQDQRFMALALPLGRRGMGRVWPNPAVGCVITRGNRIVGRGWTAQGGRPHAETRALDQAGTAARGATAYVTLEPCAHSGQTPPCAAALIAAGIARVVVSLTDPDPRVAGQGVARLRAAGIDVVEGFGKDEAARDHAGFLSRINTGRPLVTLKLATTLDGRIATASGESQWITGPLARHAVHAMRLTHDAVMIGGGTARADDPTLTVRQMGPVPQPVRIVASASLDIPIDGRLIQTLDQAPLWLLHGDTGDSAAWASTAARLFPVTMDRNGRLDPAAMLQSLGQAGLTRILCEGGGALAAALLKAGLVDRIALFTAGKAIGAEGLPSLGSLGLAALADAPRFTLENTRQLGNDTLSHWTSA
ncbi:MAG: bifunctional diaminohydroxyphosphoribosylaminopyrimidine deaminase/5-amino-6-(5-phosphoribosylamino)uracil reductase RibD [Rhodobacteraceae bacterium]|nr:bifunctional diaminohydroxyphosphoribosylaminopyrimidine deaminase/5-amino-6-(5-phosphoribosylamino)uracil reductase RibD [Paracoccaceae bacterium]